MISLNPLSQVALTPVEGTRLRFYRLAAVDLTWFKLCRSSGRREDRKIRCISLSDSNIVAFGAAVGQLIVNNYRIGTKFGC